jgi:TusA-related sulfurtransferase
MKKVDRTLDCIGLYCPMPIVNTAQEMKKMKTGEVLQVLADDQGIKLDMPAWCEATGNDYLAIEEEAGIYKVYVKKLVE